MRFKISFDFDGTLTRPKIQEYAVKCKSMGFDVHILTARHDDINGPEYLGLGTFQHNHIIYNNDVVFETAEKLKIPITNIHFNPGGYTSSGQYKNHFFEKEYAKHREYLFHIDDDLETIRALSHGMYNKKHTTIPVSCYNTAPWLSKCQQILDFNVWLHFGALNANF